MPPRVIPLTTQPVSFPKTKEARVDTSTFPDVEAALQHDDQLYEKTLSRTSEWEGRIFRVEKRLVEFQGPYGQPMTGARELVFHHGGAGVVAARDGQVCLVRQYRVALGRMTLEIPAGKVDAGEDRAACAARELTEETGLVAQGLVHLSSVYGSPGFTDEHTDVFFAQGLSQGQANPDADEALRCLWIDTQQVIDAILAGKICDSKTVVGILAASARGLL